MICKKQPARIPSCDVSPWLVIGWNLMYLRGKKEILRGTYIVLFVTTAAFAIDIHHYWKLMLFIFLMTAAPTATSVPTASAFPTTSNNAEMDLLGSLSDVFSPNPLAIVPVTSATASSEDDAQANFSGSTFAATQSASNVMNQVSIMLWLRIGV